MARTLQLPLGMITKVEELKDRIEAKKHELQARLAANKADVRAEAAEQRDRIQRKLNELEEHLKGGWDRVSDQVASKLNQWLKS